MEKKVEVEIDVRVIYTVEWDLSEEEGGPPVKPDGYVYPYWDDFSRERTLEEFVYRRGGGDEDPTVRTFLRERGNPTFAVFAPEAFTDLLGEAPRTAFFYDKPDEQVALYWSKQELLSDVMDGGLARALEEGLIDEMTHRRLAGRIEEFMANAPNL